MGIWVLTLFCMYERCNALYIKLKLFGLYNNIFFMKVSQNQFKTGFPQPKTSLPKKTVFA